MKFRLLNIVQIIVLILLILVGQSISITFIITVLSAISFYGCLYLLKMRWEPLDKTPLPLSQRISTALLLVSIALPLGYFSYWLFRYEPFVIICRYSSQCNYGAYAWSVALLSFGAALLLIIMVLRWW